MPGGNQDRVIVRVLRKRNGDQLGGRAMPDRKFLEDYPLYRWFEIEVPSDLSALDAPAIRRHCPVCRSEQTFNMSYQYQPVGAPDWQPFEHNHDMAWGVYVCASCFEFEQFFFLRVDSERGRIAKVGQEPPWDISVDPALQRFLGEAIGCYRKGLMCESQGYGIGAFSYYRRIVEDLVDELLDQIPDLMAGDERERYLQGLERTKKTTVVKDKIDLVKDLLPPILRPDGMNPLSLLHGVLSQGLHAGDDEECLELAADLREILGFLVTQVRQSRESHRRFTERMRRLLDRQQRSG